MDTDLLKTFLRISEVKNFTKAAETLGRTQASISMQISRLESILQTELFLRSPRHVELTAHGEKLILHAKKILAEEQSMLRHFVRPSFKGKIRLGAPEDLTSKYLPSILGQLSRHYPDLEIEMSCEFSQKLIEGFNQNEFDIILLKQDPLSPHPLSQAIWSEPLVWIASKDSILNQSIPSGTLPLILSPSPCVLRKKALDTLTKSHIESRIVFSSASLYSNMSAVKAGLGISVLPFDLIDDDMTIINYLPKLQEAQIALIKKSKESLIIDEIAHMLTQLIEELHNQKMKELLAK
jgi:DNA-binding transcriptional LysR family regulator